MKRGDIISWNQMAAVNEAFQQGMKFVVEGKDYSILNMSVRPNAPYADRWESDGETIIYEGHDVKGEKSCPLKISAVNPQDFYVKTENSYKQ